MNFRILDSNEKELLESDIIELLKESDKDFVPPLSQRRSTLDKSFSSLNSSESDVVSYYSEMKEQKILAAFDEGEFIGFVSFREDYLSDEIAPSELPNIYVSTLVLSRKARGKGVTKKMYSYLFDELYPNNNVFTRTWSTNVSHTKILDYFGFTEILRKRDDRGVGIDTVYYKKEKSKAFIGV